MGEGGEEQRVIAPPTQTHRSLLSSQAGSLSSKAPSPLTGPGGIGGRPGRSGEAGGRGPLRPQTGGAGEERRAFAPPTQAQEACWAPR